MDLQRQSTLLSSRTPAKGTTASNGASGRQFQTGLSSDSAPPTSKYPPTTQDDSSSTTPLRLASVNVPKSGGAISSIGEKFSTDPTTGTARLSIPIATSGINTRGSAVPSLNLSYNSGTGNGIFGYGWDLPLGQITRKTALGLPKYFDAINSSFPAEQDTFILSGLDDLVPELVFSSSGEWTQLQPDQRIINSISYFVHHYRPRVEAAFQRIERWISADGQNCHWRTISAGNVTSIYGWNAQSQISDPSDQTRIFTWLLSEVRDDRGGRFIIEYKPEDSTGVDTTLSNERNRTPRIRSARRYPKRIHYGNSTSTLNPSFNERDDGQWLFQIVFDYGEHDKIAPAPNDTGSWLVRRDPFSTYTSGFEIRTYRLCQRILMFHNFPNEPGVGSDCLVKSTNFVYADVRGTPDPTNLGDSLGTFLTNTSHMSYRRTGSTYESATLPPIELTYSFANIDPTIHGLDPESQNNLPYGVDEIKYKFVDLNGEGIAGVLSETAGDGSLMYKPPLGEGKFGPVETLPFKPSFSIINEDRILMDLERDGSLDAIVVNSFDEGFSRRTWEDFHPEWLPFKKFLSIPNINWKNDNLRFVDLTGNGLSDILITQDDVFTWHQSLGPEGFSSGARLFNAPNEEEGPRLIFADALHCIFLADMSGDGLVDIVRIRYGEVSYWPNEGYGKFGMKVSMDNAPWPDFPDAWDPSKVILADIDGNGLTDMLYLGAGEVAIYCNQSGNSWTDEQKLQCALVTDNAKDVQAVDLFGTGTICLLWSWPLCAAGQTVNYIDLMGGLKPNLLTSYVNNTGTEVKLHYAASTKFYLQDKLAGRPWLTRIPFPIQVVEKYETLDHVGRTAHGCRYLYHHGFYDGVEREFRGFGLVEQFDTEHFDILEMQSTTLPSNIDPKSSIPPVLTKTWYSTGLWMGDGQISTYFRKEYWEEPGLSNQEQTEMQIADTQLPVAAISRDGTAHPYALSPFEGMEACRALRGRVLRREVYALDDSPQQALPYSVSQSNFFLNLLQPRMAGNLRSVFMVQARETVQFSYERYTQMSSTGQTVFSPKIAHTLNLEYDPFGNVLKSASIAYGQRLPSPDPHSIMTPDDVTKQSSCIITYNEYDYTNSIDEPDVWRVPMKCESRSYELLGVTATNPDPLITDLFPLSSILQFIQQASDGSHDLPFEDWEGEGASSGAAYRRLVKRTRSVYEKNDLSASLPVGTIESCAILFQTYTMSFTEQLLLDTFISSGKVASVTEMADDMTKGGYLNLDDDGNWWIPSGRLFYSPNSTDTPLQELQYAVENFFLPLRYRDLFYTSTFDTESFVIYDTYRLLPQETVDARGNRVTAGQRDPNPANPLVENGLDYRVLTITLTMDPNQNMTAFAFDVLGMLAGSSTMGKPGQNVGDSLAGFTADLSDSAIAAYFADPISQAPILLANATTRSVYDVWAYSRTKSQPSPSPCVGAIMSRETHVSDLATGQESRILQTLGFQDGLGRIIQSKTLTEPGPVPLRDASGNVIIGADGKPSMSTTPSNPRWVGTGWVVYNNKQLLVRQYEPFFTDLSAFEFDARIGVSPTMFYDSLGRCVATLYPDHTWIKVVVKPWYSESWDQNDTILISDPKTDTDVGDFFARLPDADYLPTWYQARSGGALGSEAQTCAQNTAVHANTPSTSYTDPLGRSFLVIVDNTFKYGDASPSDPATEQFYALRMEFDIQNNVRQIVDSKDRLIVNHSFNMISQTINHQTMDSGERWSLPNAGGQKMYSFDDRSFRFHYLYDELQRKSKTFLRRGNAKGFLYEELSFGDEKGVATPEVNNVRLQIIESKDQAGIFTTNQYDFKGNLLNKIRIFAQDYRDTLDWNGAVPTELESFATSHTYDALDHETTSTLPDGSVVLMSYDQQGRTQQLSSKLQGSSTTTSFVSDIRYIANGQRAFISYGNGVTTSYQYDWFTKRLSHLLTRRNAQDFPADCPKPPDPSWPGCQIQNLAYTTDPVGNTTSIVDLAQQTVFFRNKRVDASNYYIYDSTYRLIEAGGREHLGQVNGVPNPPTPPGPVNDFGGGVPSPSDGNAMGTYVERYFYDSEGNITSLKHIGSDPVTPGWTRTYNYTETSPFSSTTFNNRLSSTVIGTTTESYVYDTDAGLHGNMTSMSGLPLLGWDARDQLCGSSKQKVANGGTPETTYYVYDATGQRARKVTETYAAAGATPTRKSQTVYLGGFEIYSRFAADGTTPTLVRDTVHILDGSKTVAMVENQKKEDVASEPLVRYQFTNHLGSVSLELDDTAAIISYEEYTPYGSSSYFAAGRKVAAGKRYRYTGKERDDEETGFYYYGARYYAHWIGRWTSSDPAGFADGLNPFVYAKSNPITLVDASGMDSSMPANSKLEMPPPPPGLGPRVGSNIHLEGPSQGPGLNPSTFPRNEINTQGVTTWGGYPPRNEINTSGLTVWGGYPPRDVINTQGQFSQGPKLGDYPHTNITHESLPEEKPEPWSPWDRGPPAPELSYHELTYQEPKEVEALDIKVKINRFKRGPDRPFELSAEPFKAGFESKKFKVGNSEPLVLQAQVGVTTLPSSGGPPPGVSWSFDLQTKRKYKARDTDAYGYAAWMQVQEAAKSLNGTPPPNWGNYINVAQQVVQYHNTVKIDDDRPYSDWGVTITYNPAQVDDNARWLYGINNNELTPNRPGLGPVSVQLTWTGRF